MEKIYEYAEYDKEICVNRFQCTALGLWLIVYRHFMTLNNNVVYFNDEMIDDIKKVIDRNSFEPETTWYFGEGFYDNGKEMEVVFLKGHDEIRHETLTIIKKDTLL